MHPQPLTRRLAYQSPWAVLARWPQATPLCFLGGQSHDTPGQGGGRFAMLALDFFPVPWQDFLNQSLGSGLDGSMAVKTTPQAEDAPPALGCGYVGLISYDAFCPQTLEAVLPASVVEPCRLLRVQQALVFDLKDKRLWLVTARDKDRAESSSPAAAWHVRCDEAMLSHLLNPEPVLAGPNTAGGLSLRPLGSDSAYLAAVQQAIAEIKAGRFYQINLLRYFALTQGLDQRGLLRRLQAYAGPHGAWLQWPDLAVVSFSPERFVQLQAPARQAGSAQAYLTARTEPIKGTAARDLQNPQADQRVAERLALSPKDRAELHMIVDLMRNDLHRVSAPGSVQVVSPGEVHSFASVHHLVARIEAQLPSSLRWQDFFTALCPGGSITGAPKHEVMHAIAAYEGRRRGYFMGHVFFRGDQGYFDSSILIRSLVGKGNAYDFSWEYAAGSGIVYASVPQQELAEVAAKCRVLTLPLPARG